MIATVSEAAASINRARATIYRLINAGLLKDWERPGPDGRMRLELDGLEARVGRLVRQQANSRPKQVKPTPVTDVDWWEQVAPIANSFLDLEQWDPPPWTGHQWATLAVVIDLASESHTLY